ncbi:hypothetical protein EV122DRAFT_278277 [Schizophyllum commune]
MSGAMPGPQENFNPSLPVDACPEYVDLKEKYAKNRKVVHLQHKIIHQKESQVRNLAGSLQEVHQETIPLLKEEIVHQKSRAVVAEAQVTRVSSDLHLATKSITELRRELYEWHLRDALVQYELDKAHDESKSLSGRLRRMTHSVQRKIEQGAQRAVKKGSTFKLKEKGAFSVQARALARLLYDAGVPEHRVGRIIQQVGKAFGITIEECMSRRSVHRAIGEGGEAAKLQLMYEIAISDNFTFSSDSTSHRSVEWTARHVTLRVPDYANPSGGLVIRTRLLGVHSAPNHSSDAQIYALKLLVRAFACTFSASPLAKRLRLEVKLYDFVRKMIGANGDHSSDQKKVGNSLGEMHFEANLEHLGREEMLAMAIPELSALYHQIAALSVEQAGGELAWAALPVAEQDEIMNNVESTLLVRLGGAVYEMMPVSEQKQLRRFLWSGCCMHKDLNIVKHADRAMSSYWTSKGLDGPVILPNKDNSAVLAARDEASGDAPTELEERALEASGRGGVKATQLGGLICRHKDDKTGQQDRFRFYLTHELRVKHTVQYPGTSNTRYQSHTEAACFILRYRDILIAFMHSVRDTKQSPGWTNIEKNFYSALNDLPTLSELVVLALWHILISCPWMQHIRQPGLNMLTLGPYFKSLRAHMVSLRDDPARVFGPSASHQTATADGEPYNMPEVMTAILALLPSLPHVVPLFHEFMNTAVVTFDRFTAEFNPDGAIASLTEEEASSFFINTTNDHNEGILGSLRNIIRSHPSISQRALNARLMYKQNDTQDFMDTVMTEPEDYAYLMRLNREQDASGLEAKRRAEEVEYRKRVAEETRRREIERAEEERRKREELQSKNLILNVSDIETLRFKKDIEEQLNIHRLYDADIPAKSAVQKLSRDDQRTLLLRVVSEFYKRALKGNATELASKGQGRKKRKAKGEGKYDTPTSAPVEQSCEDVSTHV